MRVVPDDLAGVFTLCPTPLEAAEGASALVIETDWLAYREVEPERLVAAMRSPIVVDRERLPRSTVSATAAGSGTSESGVARA